HRLLSRSFFYCSAPPRALHSFPTRRSSDLRGGSFQASSATSIVADERRGVGSVPDSLAGPARRDRGSGPADPAPSPPGRVGGPRSEEHTSELQSLTNLVCRLLLEKKKQMQRTPAGLTRLVELAEPLQCRAVDNDERMQYHSRQAYNQGIIGRHAHLQVNVEPV